jgi:hypothetical protein
VGKTLLKIVFDYRICMIKSDLLPPDDKPLKLDAQEKAEKYWEDEEGVKKNFPSLELAYPIAIASYETMMKRFDAMDGRIQTMTAFAVTASLALPTLGKSWALSFSSPWFITGISLLIFAIGISVYTRLTGQIRVLDPANLLADSLYRSQTEFRYLAIKYAASSFRSNKKLLDRKWFLSVITMAIFAAAIIALFLWLLAGHPIPPSAVSPS